MDFPNRPLSLGSSLPSKEHSTPDYAIKGIEFSLVDAWVQGVSGGDGGDGGGGGWLVGWSDNDGLAFLFHLCYVENFWNATEESFFASLLRTS